MSKEIELTQEEENEYVLHVFSNVANDAPALSMLMMFADGVFKNKVGLMRAKHAETGEETLILVGIETQEDGSSLTYPLARVMTAEEATFYHSPDGLGGFQAGTYTKGSAVEEAEAA